jgi:hypothetical protein
MSNSRTSIYVIGPEGGPFKIGYSACPHSRLSSLQTGSTQKLILHYSEETDTEIARVIEQLIHRQIGHKRIRGEWFDVGLDEAIGEVRFAFIRWEDEPYLVSKFKNKLL